MKISTIKIRKGLFTQPPDFIIREQGKYFICLDINRDLTKYEREVVSFCCAKIRQNPEFDIRRLIKYVS